MGGCDNCMILGGKCYICRQAEVYYPPLQRIDEVYLPLNGEGRYLPGKAAAIYVMPSVSFRLTEIHLSPLTKKYFRILKISIGHYHNMIGDHDTYLHGSLFPMKVTLKETCGPNQQIKFEVQCVRKPAYFHGCIVGVAVMS